MGMRVFYCSSARATSRNPAAEVLLRSHVTLLWGKAVTFTKRKTPHSCSLKQKEGSCPSPEAGVDLQGFAQHLGSDVVHVVPAQVHLPQAGVATQGVDQDGSPGAQP